MRHKRKVRAVASLEENREQSNETEHGVLIVRVELADDDQDDTSHDTDEVDP
jgi:hypothetical protein